MVGEFIGEPEMKTYNFTCSEDRILEVKENTTIVMKEKGAENKIFEFTPSRWVVLKTITVLIDNAVKDLYEGKDVKFTYHIGGGNYVSVTSGYRCVDFRKFYQLPDQAEIKPTKKGLALRLKEWSEMEDLIARIDQDNPTFANAQPRNGNSDHDNQMAYLQCPECNPFQAQK